MYYTGRTLLYMLIPPCLQVGYDVTKAAADTVFRQSGYTPQQVDVVELHDCFSANELITYEALGLCAPGLSVCLVVCLQLSFVCS